MPSHEIIDTGFVVLTRLKSFLYADGQQRQHLDWVFHLLFGCIILLGISRRA